MTADDFAILEVMANVPNWSSPNIPRGQAIYETFKATQLPASEAERAGYAPAWTTDEEKATAVGIAVQIRIFDALRAYLEGVNGTSFNQLPLAQRLAAILQAFPSASQYRNHLLIDQIGNPYTNPAPLEFRQIFSQLTRSPIRDVIGKRIVLALRDANDLPLDSYDAVLTAVKEYMRQDSPARREVINDILKKTETTIDEIACHDEKTADLLANNAERNLLVKNIYEAATGETADGRNVFFVILRAVINGSPDVKQLDLLAGLFGHFLKNGAAPTGKNQMIKTFLTSFGVVGVKLGQILSKQRWVPAELRGVLEDLSDRVDPRNKRYLVSSTSWRRAYWATPRRRSRATRSASS